LTIAAVLLAVEGIVQVIAGAFFYVGDPRGIELRVLDDVYAVGPPVWPWVLVPLGVLELLASYLAGSQRRVWFVLATATGAALVGLGAGISTGGWAWFMTRGVVALMILTSRRAFID
jgi:hypothetical protein